MRMYIPMEPNKYKELKNGRSVYCTLKEAPWKVTAEMIIGYGFLKEKQIQSTKTFPPSENAVPTIGWYRCGGSFSSPERGDDFIYKNPDDILVEVDIPLKLLLFSDALAWNAIMNGEYYPYLNDLEALDKELKEFQEMNVFEQEKAIRQSWERAMDVDLYGDFVVGTVWKIEPWMLVEKHCKEE